MENLWSSILGEVQTQSNTKLPSNKWVLVLGDNASFKTTLVAKLQGVEDPKKGSALEYAYIDVRDVYSNDLTHLGVWILDGDTGHVNLLKYALNELNYAHTLVILTPSMTAPWRWVDQLNHWMKILEDHIAGLKIEHDEKQQCQQRLANEWQHYCETIDDLDPGSPIKLPERVLTTNLGLDVMVVVTKIDYMSTLEKELGYRDEYFDFMQQWIRLCLKYGASLFYTSVKEDKHYDLLYKYLTHRIYCLLFRTPALVAEKDAVFIPAGWDNMQKISILYENMQTYTPDDYYRSRSSRKRSSLIRQLQLLQQEQQPARGESPLRSQPSNIIRNSPRNPVAAVAQGSPKKVDDKLTPGTQSGEGVLANFFNSLLYMKTVISGSAAAAGAADDDVGAVIGLDSPLELTPDDRIGPDGVSPSNKITMRKEASLELDRLARSLKRNEFSPAQQSDC